MKIPPIGVHVHEHWHHFTQNNNNFNTTDEIVKFSF